VKPPAGGVAAEASLRPGLGAALGPALLVALAAPAFFVLLQPWLAWALLVAGIGFAAALERGRVAASTPSLTRDLSLIAVGLAIVSTMSLEAKLDDASMVRFTLVLGGAVAVPYALSRWVYRDRAIAFPGGAADGGVRGSGDGSPPCWCSAGSSCRSTSSRPVSTSIGRSWMSRVSSRACSSAWERSASGTSCSSSAPCSRPCAATSRMSRRTCFRRSCSSRSCGNWATARGAVLTIPFALLQAVIFLKTRSLAYVVTVHLLFDAVVFAVLVHAHNPGMLDGLFLVSP
jgi:hypothetical protein